MGETRVSTRAMAPKKKVVKGQGTSVQDVTQQDDGDEEEDDDPAAYGTRDELVQEVKKGRKTIAKLDAELAGFRDLRLAITTVQDHSSGLEAQLAAEVHSMQQQIAKLSSQIQGPGRAQSGTAPPSTEHAARHDQPGNVPSGKATSAGGRVRNPPSQPPTASMKESADAPAATHRGLLIKMREGQPLVAAENMLKALEDTLRVPISLAELQHNTPDMRKQPTGDEEEEGLIASWAACGMTMVATPKTAAGAETTAEGTAQQAKQTVTRQCFVVTFANESIGAVRDKFKKLRAMGIAYHDDLSPQQRRHKAAQKDIATGLWKAGTPIRWDFDQLSKQLPGGRWVVVPFLAQ